MVEEGKTGWTFPPGDSEALADVLAELDTDREVLSQMSSNCRALAEQFDYDRIAVETEAILQAVSDGAAIPEFGR